MSEARRTTEKAYSDRTVEVVEIAKVHDGGSVTWTNGWSFGGIPSEHRHLLTVGAEFLSETIRLTQVTGMATMYRTSSGEPVVDEWLWHKTDADLDREHAEMVAGFKREREARWQANKRDWARREALLPLSLRRRLDRFRANGGHEFETDGWGYELVVCELAVLYAASGQAESVAIEEYAREHGTSGNQHGYARALSRHLTDDPEDEDAVANSVSALSPITGNADYSAMSSPPAQHPPTTDGADR